MTKRFTAKQGQYLAFIDHYLKVPRRAPAEADFVEHFRVSPPSVHQMIVALAKNELISRVPSEASSIRLRIRPEEAAFAQRRPVERRR
jgi:DNA-binding MarR family transcriptional regulator